MFSLRDDLGFPFSRCKSCCPGSTAGRMSDIMLCLGERNNRRMSYIGYIFIYLIRRGFLLFFGGFRGGLGFSFGFRRTLRTCIVAEPMDGWMDGPNGEQICRLLLQSPTKGWFPWQPPKCSWCRRGFSSPTPPLPLC